MIEPIMYLAIGFLVSMLFGLMIVPLVHNRAVRLTTRRLEAATPLSMAEIQADKDQLRAEFAMSARRLEMSVDQLKNKTTSQLAELGKKSDAINRMKLELGEKNATIFSLEAREKAVKEQLRATEEEFAAKTEALRDRRAGPDRQAERTCANQLRIVRPFDDGREPPGRTDRGARADRGTKSRVGDAEKDSAATQTTLTQERGESEKRTPRSRRGAQPGRKSEPARHRSRSPVDCPGQGSRNARQPRQRPGNAAWPPKASCSPSATMKTTSCARPTRPPKDRAGIARRTGRRERRQIAGAGKAARREGRRRRTARRRPRRTRQAAARHQRDPAAGRKLLGHRAHGECAVTRTHQRHRRRSRQARDAARRAEFADRGHAGRRARDACKTRQHQRRRRQWRSRHRRRARSAGTGTLAERIRALQSHASRARQQGA